jgi:succinyl-CoA synthetase beta subunit
VVATMPECLAPDVRDAIAARGLAPLQGLRESLIALDRAAWLGAHDPQNPPAPVSAPGSTKLVDEERAKNVLASHGVRVPRGERTTRAELESAASSVGYPVTLKGLGLAHKSESGAVAIGLNDAGALRAAVEGMPGSISEFLVEETVTGIVAEVLVSIRRAAPLGWLVTIGAGGVLTELWKDTQSLLAPASRNDIETAITKLRIAPILAGYRGKPAGDVTALVDFIEHLQRVVVGTNMVEVELNPVLVTTSAAIAVDALLIEEA